MGKHTFTCTGGKCQGQQITTDLEAQEVLRIFHRTAGGSNWLWYWLVKHAEENKHRVDLSGGKAESAAVAPPIKPTCQGMMDFISDSFVFALGMGLKKPMIRIHFKGKRYKIYLSKAGTICIKTGHVEPGTHKPTGNEQYMGCILRGEFLPATLEEASETQPAYYGRYRRYSTPARTYNPNAPKRPLSDEEKEFLAEMSKDPVGFMARTSKDMCRCCYCDKPLTDKRSKDVGYGPDCAEHWGLPWGKSYDEKVPSFASLWQASNPQDQVGVRSLCQAIKEIRAAWLEAKSKGAAEEVWKRLQTEEQMTWAVLCDALTDMGHTKMPTMPEEKVKYPRA